MSIFKPGMLVRRVSKSGVKIGIIRIDGKAVYPPQGPVSRNSDTSEVLEPDENTVSLVPFEVDGIGYPFRQTLEFGCAMIGISNPFVKGERMQTSVKDHDARKAMLEKFRDDYPKWTDIVTMAIFNGTADAILPARETSLLDGGAEERDLVLLEPGVKGPPAIFRYEGIEITCINYSGSYDPMSAKKFIQVIGQASSLIAKLPDPETWIQSFVK